jgi:HEAT repeat protein
MRTADIAMQLAAWPEGRVHADLPKWAALLAARGTGAINDLSSALSTAETNTGRGVLSDALARIGTDDAIQELCTQAVKAPDGAPRQAIATAFRALSRPAAVPFLATVLSEVDSAPLIAEAGDAIRRLADRAGVEALADMTHESNQSSSQRDIIFRILSTLESPEALPALQVLAADGTDTARADAARAGISRLKHKGKE